MKSLSVVLIFKIVFTVVLWCLPLLFFPESLLIKLGLPEPSSMLFLRLLGMAYVALVVGYCFGLRKTLKGERPTDVVWVGIVSNGGACLLLLSYGLLGAWQTWGFPATILMWVSGVITGAITLGLLITGVLPAKRDSQSS